MTIHEPVNIEEWTKVINIEDWTEVMNKDAIDEIVDWQLQSRYGGTAVCRPMFQLMESEETVLCKSARWTPNLGWINGF